MRPSKMIFLNLVFLAATTSFLNLAVWPLSAGAEQMDATQLVQSARERTRHKVRYDGAYVALDYPGGDVPADTGVCTDVVIRSFRGIGADLQKLVHEDISSRFNEYPSNRIWGLHKPDRNIDHRRVPNLQEFFETHGQSLRVSADAADYKPGDIVSWMLPGNLPHIGIVSNQMSDNGVPLIVHNIGAGPEESDMLFSYDITGHYRYLP